MDNPKCCQSVQKPEDLCPTCKVEFEAHLDAEALRARIQELYEEAQAGLL